MLFWGKWAVWWWSGMLTDTFLWLMLTLPSTSLSPHTSRMYLWGINPSIQTVLASLLIWFIELRKDMHIVDAESHYFLGASTLFYRRTTSAGRMVFNFSICEIINSFPERIHMGKCGCETLNFKENKYFKILPKKNFLHHYNPFPTRGIAHFFLMYGVLQDLSWFRPTVLKFWMINPVYWSTEGFWMLNYSEDS